MKRSDKLTFYCQLCNAEIKGNICPDHGIDFVTIKKVVPKSGGTSGERSRRINGMTPIEFEVRGGDDPQGENSLSRPGGGKETVHLPVLPTETGEEQGLKPMSDSIGQSTAGTVGASTDEAEYVFAHEAEYQELDAESLHRYYDRQRHNRRPTATVAKANRSLILPMLSIVALIILTGIYFGVFYTQSSAEDIYSLAETHYGTQEFAQAEELYSRLVELYPNDPLAKLANHRLVMLASLTASGTEMTPEQHMQIQEWLFKANLAYRNTAYLLPENDNVLFYINRVMAIEPGNAPAHELQKKLLNHYENLAKIALRDNNYDAALGFYQKAIKVQPGSDVTIEKMRQVLEIKNAKTL